MKKKPIALVSRIAQFVEQNPDKKAAEIQKGLGLKRGNIYVVLNHMISKGMIKKSKDKTYSWDGRMPLFANKTNSLQREKINSLINQQPQPQPNPYLNSLKREHEHIMQGIQQLQITANYLNLRIRELERAAQQ